MLKKIAKTIIRTYYKIRLFFHVDKSHLKTDGSWERLQSLYPIKEYDLSSQIKKDNNPLIHFSIIVPVYNSEKYISKCIDSLLTQKTKYQYEIICIDDGSTDSSLQIISNYKDNRIKIIHQDNQGISGARNTGLNNAKGKYVGFVDNDDYVSEEYVEKIVSRAIEISADYMKCSYQVFDDSNIVETKQYKDSVLTNLDDISDYQNWLHGYMWGGCYKRDIWENFCFPLGYWYEDMVRNMYLFDRCKIIGSIDDILYFKRKHNNNAADTLWKKDSTKCLDQLYLLYELIDLKKRNGIKNNNLSKVASLLEMGEYLYKRTQNLSKEVRKDAFMIACDLFSEMQIEEDLIKLDDILFKLYKSLKNRDYQLYELVCKYYRFK